MQSYPNKNGKARVKPQKQYQIIDSHPLFFCRNCEFAFLCRKSEQNTQKTLGLFTALLYTLSLDGGQLRCYSILIKRKDAEE